jgi:hypothetical protein
MGMKKKSSRGRKSPGFGVHHDAFIREGLMAAMPLGFPGTTTAIPADESFVTALMLNRADHFETLWGGTSGRRAHIFFAWMRGVTGVVVDLGGDGESTETAGVACLKSQAVAAVNGPSGARLLARHYGQISYDCIQEWGMDMTPFARVAELPGERIAALEADSQGRGVVLVLASALAAWDPAGGLRHGPEVKLTGLSQDGGGGIFGIGRDGELVRVERNAREIRARKTGRVKGDFRTAVFSTPFPGKPLYLADARGTMFRLGSRETKPIGRTPLAPVTCMVVTRDGRLFGFCGNEIAHMFEYDPISDKVRDLGVALSLLNRRRYGYEFSCAQVNRDGHLFFGENDRGGHLWVYCPGLK